MASHGRHIDEPEREPTFTDTDAAAPHDTIVVCDTCGLTFVSPPYRAGDACPSRDADCPCRGRLTALDV